MATLTIITSGMEWSRARDFGCEYVDNATAERLAARLVTAFDRRTGLTWDAQTGLVYGPEDWAGDPAELHAIREDASDGVFAAFMDKPRWVVAKGSAWRRDQIGNDADDYRMLGYFLANDDSAADVVRDFNCRTGLTWDATAGEVTASNVDVYDYWADRWGTLDAIRAETVEEILAATI